MFYFFGKQGPQLPFLTPFLLYPFLPIFLPSFLNFFHVWWSALYRNAQSCLFFVIIWHLTKTLASLGTQLNQAKTHKVVRNLMAGSLTISSFHSSTHSNASYFLVFFVDYFGCFCCFFFLFYFTVACTLILGFIEILR